MSDGIPGLPDHVQMDKEAAEHVIRELGPGSGLEKAIEDPQHQIVKREGFAELQEQAVWSLAWQDIAGARDAIKAMKEFVAMAERDLEKLIAWTRSSEQT